jgi:hypothetical protein
MGNVPNSKPQTLDLNPAVNPQPQPSTCTALRAQASLSRADLSKNRATPCADSIHEPATKALGNVSRPSLAKEPNTSGHVCYVTSSPQPFGYIRANIACPQASNFRAKKRPQSRLPRPFSSHASPVAAATADWWRAGGGGGGGGGDSAENSGKGS